MLHTKYLQLLNKPMQLLFTEDKPEEISYGDYWLQEPCFPLSDQTFYDHQLLAGFPVQ